MTAPVDPKTKESKFSFDDIKALLELGESYWDPIFRECEADIIFSYATGLDQWSPLALQARGGRPAETYNIINGFVRPVVNMAKQNPPAINVFPISDGASKTNSKLLSGIIRSIEYGCGAQREYCSALESAVRGGLGIVRVIPKLSSVDDDDVDFVISNESDPTKIIIDPSAKKADFSDANWVIVKNTMSERQYRRDYPDGHAEGVQGIVNINELWVKEYYNKDTVDPKTGFPTKKRTLRILQYMFDDNEILEKIDTYPGKYLPFAVVSGSRYTADGVTHYQSLTREIKGVQTEINFLKSEEIATIACAPKATFYGDNDVFQSTEEREAWENAATNPQVFLGHKPGAAVNQFNMPQIPTAYIESVKDNLDLARVITGQLHDPSQEQGLNPASGKALKEQAAGQAISTYTFVDSLNYAIKHIGEIILDLLPYYWNDNRIRLSMGVDGKYSSVSMGDQDVDGAENFDLSYGKYSVSISTGPSYASQKDALIEMILDSIKTNPQAMAIALPWIINQINLPGSEELSDMFSLTLPPEIQQFIQQMKHGSSDPEEKLKSAMLQLHKMGQDAKEKSEMIKQLTAALQNETAELKSKEQEIQSSVQIAQERNRTQLMIEQMKGQHELQIEQLKAQVEAMSKSIELAHIEHTHRQDTAASLAIKELDHQNAIEQMNHKGAVDTIVSHLAPKPAAKPAKK